jgi:hypothetical protein
MIVFLLNFTQDNSGLYPFCYVSKMNLAAWKASREAIPALIDLGQEVASSSSVALDWIMLHPDVELLLEAAFAAKTAVLVG